MLSKWEITRASQIAMLLEVSAYPKPGNVHRTRDFEDLKYEDFLFCGVFMGESIFDACRDAKNGKLRTGYHIRRAVEESMKWVKKNTNLGIILLHIPIAQAATISEDFLDVRRNLEFVCKGTKTSDAIEFFEALRIAEPGGMGSLQEFDVTSERGRRDILKKEITLFDLFYISKDWDNIAREWSESFEISYFGFEKLKENFYGDFNIATVKSFLEILSRYPDTLILRKAGIEKAKNVSERAREILEDFEISKVWEFDDELRKNRNLNPGTTADILSASLFLWFLEREELRKTKFK